MIVLGVVGRRRRESDRASADVRARRRLGEARGGGLHLRVPDVDAAFARALAAGATAAMPPTDMFWGDRYCKVVDPYGHHWSLATPKEKLTPEEIQRRGAEAFKN